MSRKGRRALCHTPTFLLHWRWDFSIPQPRPCKGTSAEWQDAAQLCFIGSPKWIGQCKGIRLVFANRWSRSNWNHRVRQSIPFLQQEPCLSSLQETQAQRSSVPLGQGFWKWQATGERSLILLSAENRESKRQIVCSMLQGTQGAKAVVLTC